MTTELTIKNVVKELLMYDVLRWHKWEAFNRANIEVHAYDNENPLELALDLMGFPKDNSSQYSSNPSSPQAEGDYDKNFFCHDYFSDLVHTFSQQEPLADIEILYQQLLEELEETRNEAPHLFMHIS
ncbi:hypothetical protein ACFPAF_14145 [Hymenobacter endophyticus]|uniref:Uncharacterized protein n=1 Tax=Hymenobacter endophyticus TaxID=3076335 RepID=A0ABU3TJJ3_9BACT|nr:hypothetical protein [Hymenobacter endophyticus]MDU0371544.1 hypothetical protein [Hymenobacter endophyticus]